VQVLRNFVSVCASVELLNLLRFGVIKTMVSVTLLMSSILL